MLINLLSQNGQLIVALTLFIITYLFLLMIPKYRAYIALISALIFIIIGFLSLKEIIPAIDWNVILMIMGTMGLVALFIESKMPAYLADRLTEQATSVRMAIILLSLFAGVISAFIDNVATVLIAAPIAITIAKRVKISPVTPIIAISVVANLEGVATLVGDATSMMLGSHYHMDFLDFFFYQGKPGLFFIVQGGLILATLALYFILKADKIKISIKEHTVVNDYFPTYLIISLLIMLIIASFIPNKPNITNGLISVFLMLVGILYQSIRHQKKASFLNISKEIDFFTLALLIGLFIVIKGISNAGVIDEIATLIANLSQGNIFVVYTLIVFISVILSAFIDNIPYVATMLPVVGIIAANLGLANPTVLYFGLLVGATLGGNLTPVGASANITGIGILKKHGYEVTKKDFIKVGLPYTMAAVISGYLLVWFLFH